jgi:hypothetical protein
MATRIQGIAGDLQQSVREIAQRYHAYYEVRPYYVVLDQRPAGAPEIAQKLQAGFEVNLYGALEKEHLPLFGSEDARKAVKYLESVAHEVQSQVGQGTTVEVIPYTESILLDTHQHFQPEAMVQIRISHNRGLDQPQGQSEEQALKAIRDTLHELGIREG